MSAPISILHIALLALVQGLAELLPVSSSAHVIVTEKLLGIDPTSPEATLLLVMLHTGTMFAVIVYFWSAWRKAYFSSMAAFTRIAGLLAMATIVTGIVGLGLMTVIKHVYAGGAANFEIEQLFGNPRLIAAALAAAGMLIIASSRIPEGKGDLTGARALLIGAVQGLCLPFRGFSRSGATISTGLICGVTRARTEAFSFALAVVLTPAVLGREVLRLIHARAAMPAVESHAITRLLAPGLLGMVLSFGAGLLALRWLSRWLEGDRWHLFGGYCLAAAGFIAWFFR